MKYMITAELALMILFLLTVESHPICQQTCYTNLTANVTVLNEWLSLQDDSKGIDQLRSRKDTSIAKLLLSLTTTTYDDCLTTYFSMVTAPQSVNASVDNIRDYFNAYLMHKTYVEHLVNLSTIGLLTRKWVQTSTAGDVHDNLKDLLTVLAYNVKNLAQLVHSTCSGCEQNCSISEEKSASIISAMEDCRSPLRNIIFVITQHSEDLYNTIRNLKVLSEDQPADDSSGMGIDDDDLCWCSVRT